MCFTNLFSIASYWYFSFIIICMVRLALSGYFFLSHYLHFLVLCGYFFLSFHFAPFIICCCHFSAVLQLLSIRLRISSLISAILQLLSNRLSILAFYCQYQPVSSFLLAVSPRLPVQVATYRRVCLAVFSSHLS